MTHYVELFAVFTVQLLVIVDPIAGLPVFLAITPEAGQAERKRMVWRGVLAAFCVIVFFLLCGRPLLAYFGIGAAAVRICGGILLFVIALEMLYGRPTGTGTSRREERLAGAKDDISFTPLAFPLLAGPGAIATSLLFAQQAQGAGDYLALLAAAAVVFALTGVLLARADRLLRMVGDLGAAILTRLMGLVLAFLAVQYVVDGVRAVFGVTT